MFHPTKNIHHPRFAQSRIIIAASLLLSSCGSAPPPASTAPEKKESRKAEKTFPPTWKGLLDYIDQGWTDLRRDVGDLPMAAPDPKFKARDASLLYIAQSEQEAAVQHLLDERFPGAESAFIDLRVLPEDPTRVTEHGLLFLPFPYVVPNGHVHEMYGWDSYFIARGLLSTDWLTHVRLAREITGNLIYQIKHYGTVLNANRTYYLSQPHPPFLTRMVLGVFEKTEDERWLRSTLDAIRTQHGFWTSERHQTPTGLSRYRAQHESGFDPSGRFGSEESGIENYNPVCLNTLLYVMESDMHEILSELGELSEASEWQEKADARKTKINELLWDDQAGLYVDYDIVQENRHPYPFATTFWPLWAGIASTEQAKRVVEQLAVFERKGGLRASTKETGDAWDAPYGWANLHMLAVDGLRRYGYDDEAERISLKFLRMVFDEFVEHGTLVEKYDVERAESGIEAGTRIPYSSKDIGFGWTNAAALTLYAELSKQGKESLQSETDHKP